MRITDLLSKESIRLDGVSSTKKETIRAMADLMEKSGKISDKNAYVEGLIKREEESTTAVGEGIAIPHYKGSAVTKPGLAAMVIKDGTDFDSIDGEPVKLIFAIAAPDTKENVHLDVLSKLSVLLMDEDFSQKLALMCKKHKDISDKEIKFALMKDVSVEVAEKPQIGEKIAYLTVSGPDTYYEDDMLDENNPTKMVFIGREVDKVIKNLTVTAVYAGGAREELPRSKYTVTADKLNMKKSGQTHLTVKSNSSSLWDNSAYAQFVIDVVGDDDIAPLIVDSGTNGRFELASWEWNDFVTEAAQEDGKKSFGASIIRYNGNYYYYPDGLTIVNDNKNNNMFKFALDVGDETKPAYYIQFDTSSVVINDNDSKIHNGSVKIENDLIYIWQEKSSKELDTGWIRVYCDLKKY